MRRRGHEDVSAGWTKKKSVKTKTVKVEARSSWRTWLVLVLVFLCTLFMAIPYILRLFPGVLQCLVFSHSVTYFVDLSRPADLGLNHTINMYLSSDEGVTLGIWHTVPEQNWKEAQDKGPEWYEKSLGDGSPVFIYLHGNMGNRAAPHRVGVANLISSLGYHALVIDYRGFGDSTGEPTEAGLTTDALYLYHWVRARSKDSLVIIWGQSLGTAVATNTAVKLQEQDLLDHIHRSGITLKPRTDEIKYKSSWKRYFLMAVACFSRIIDQVNFEEHDKELKDIIKDGQMPVFPGNPVDAVIIEGVFTHATVKDISTHPMVWYYWRFPYIQFFFLGINKLKENTFILPNDENLKKMKTPLMILHAKDDNVIPFQMAEELYSIARTAQKSDDHVKLVLFDESLGYLHNGLYRDPQMPSILRKFVQSLKA